MGLRNPPNRFRWNLEYATVSWVWPHVQIHVALQQRGWSGRTRDMWPVRFLSIPLKFFCYILLLVPSLHQWSDFDNIYVIQRVYVQGSAFWGSCSYCFPFWGSNPAKTLILGAWIVIFKLNVHILKLAYYRNNCPDYNQILHSHKNYQKPYVLGSNAWSKSKMADGRHLEKSKMGHVSATVLPIGTKFSMMMHIGPPKWLGR